MKNNELISVIIPVFNTEKYLVRCLNSVLIQSYTNLEIILIDDGSMDKSYEICKKYANLDKRIKVIKQENGGASKARNKGISIAKGKYIGFVDSDDIIDKDMFKILYNNMINYNADLSICEVTRFNTEPIFNHSNETKIYNKEEALKVLLEDKKICSYSVNKLCKKELIKNIKYPEGKLQEDVGTIYKFITNANKIVYTDSKLYGYFTRPGSVTKTLKKDFIYDYFEMIEKRYNDLLTYNINLYLDLNYVNVILGTFIDLSLNQDLLHDNKLKLFMNEKYKKLKVINTKEIKKVNTTKHNILINILLLNRKIFYKVMNLYLNIKQGG